MQFDTWGERIAELAGAAGSRIETILDVANERLNALSKNASEKEKEEIRILSGLGERLRKLKRENDSQTEKMAYLKTKMFRRNPTATSSRFKEEFSQIREEQLRWYERRRQDKKKKKS